MLSADTVSPLTDANSKSVGAVHLRTHKIPACPKAGDRKQAQHLMLDFLFLIQWKCTSMPDEVNEPLHTTQLNALLALGGLQSWVTACLGMLPAAVRQGVAVPPLFACGAPIDITADFRHGPEGNRWPQVLQMSSCF